MTSRAPSAAPIPATTTPPGACTRTRPTRTRPGRASLSSASAGRATGDPVEPRPSEPTTDRRTRDGIRVASFTSRRSLRNVALVAHVDHGKTTLVDAMLRADRRVRRPPGSWSTGSWTPTTRSASGASRSSPRRPSVHVEAASRSTSSTRPATPTSAARSSGRWPWSTACCCSSTPPRARCPRPATCCPRRSAADLPAVVVLNKVDRTDARADEVLDEIYQLFLDLEVPTTTTSSSR